MTTRQQECDAAHLQYFEASPAIKESDLSVTVMSAHTGIPTNTEAPPGRPEEPVVGVVAKVARIVETFGGSGDHLLLDEIMRATGFPRSTTFRILKQLIEAGWVEHDEHGYFVGMHLSAMSEDSLTHIRLRGAAAPSLNALHAATGAVVHLTVLSGPWLHYLDKIGGRLEPSIPSHVGERLPAHSSLSGLVMLAQLPGEEVDVLLGTVATPAETTAATSRIAAIRKQRPAFAVDVDSPSGITYAAAPIMVRKRPIGAISVCTRGELVRSKVIPALLMSINHTATAMS